MKRKIFEMNKEYEKIIHSPNLSEYQKACEVAKIMTRMEKAFAIPILKDEQFEKENKLVMSLYLKLSASRSF